MYELQIRELPFGRELLQFWYFGVPGLAKRRGRSDLFLACCQYVLRRIVVIDRSVILDGVLEVDDQVPKVMYASYQ